MPPWCCRHRVAPPPPPSHAVSPAAHCVLFPTHSNSGRLDQHIRVDLPDHHARREIAELLLRRTPVNLGADAEELGGQTTGGKLPLCEWLAKSTDGASGADLKQLCQNAALRCLRDNPAPAGVEMRHFRGALAESGFGTNVGTIFGKGGVLLPGISGPAAAASLR